MLLGPAVIVAGFIELDPPAAAGEADGLMLAALGDASIALDELLLPCSDMLHLRLVEEQDGQI